MKATVLGWGVVAALFAFSGGIAARTLDEIRSSGELRVGVAKAIPWVMTDRGNELLGSEVDIANLISSDLGTTVTFAIMNWDELVPALKENKIDAIVSGLSITPRRAVEVAFTRPYENSTVGFLARRDSRLGKVKDLHEANVVDVVVGATQGTIGSEVAHDVFYNATIKEFPTFAVLLEELLAGRLHAIVASQPLPRLAATENPQILVEPLREPLHKEVEAIAVRQGDQNLLNFLNAWIALREADGFLARTHAYWFDGSDWMSRFGPRDAAQSEPDAPSSGADAGQ